jgi:hypothetical protein
MRAQIKEKQNKLKTLLQLNPTIDNPMDEVTAAHCLHRVTNMCLDAAQMALMTVDTSPDWYGLKAKVRKASLAKEAIVISNTDTLPLSSALTVPKERARGSHLSKAKENPSIMETEARGMLVTHIGVKQTLPLLSHRTRRSRVDSATKLATLLIIAGSVKLCIVAPCTKQIQWQAAAAI